LAPAIVGWLLDKGFWSPFPRTSRRSMIVEVCGLLTHDSGKTWLSVNLVKSLRRLGLRTAIHKPVAGHSAWYQMEAIEKSMELGMLVGSDVATYIESLGVSREEIPVVNPIDLLLAPPDPSRYLAGGLRKYIEHAEEHMTQLVMARLTLEDGAPRHLLVRENLARLTPSMRRVVEKLAERVGAEEASLEDVVLALRSRATEMALLRMLDTLEKRSDIVVVESFNDAVVPYIAIAPRLSILIAVAPGWVGVYTEIGELIRSIETEIGLRGEEGLRSPYPLSRLRPAASIEIPPARTMADYDQKAVSRLVDIIVQRLRKPTPA